MALFVRQDENRTELQQRLATELQERAKLKAKQADQPDGVEDSQFIKGTTQSTGLAWLWALVAVLAIGTVLFLMIKANV